MLIKELLQCDTNKRYYMCIHTYMYLRRVRILIILRQKALNILASTTKLQVLSTITYSRISQK